jgi:Type I restriction enzyme R protein N terminus (HSDR_N)
MRDAKADVLDELSSICRELSARDVNEAETRHRIIDFILHTYLAWPKNRVKVEEYIQPGFADYVLKKSNEDDLLFIEAKKAGHYFTLPIPHSSMERASYISIKKLLTDANVKAAMDQVRTYCFNTGCEYACITNGFEWVFFKTFEKGKRWETIQAFVIRNLDFFSADYTKAVNSLSFVAITEHSSLPTLLSSAPPKDRPIYYPKEKIPSYSHSIRQNRLAPKLRPIANRYFGVIGDDDTPFMESCYVAQREYQGTSDGMRALIQDSLSPYFEDYGVQQLEDTGKGGRLGGRLTKNIKESRRGEVLVLFGGKGAGKSTFIKRLLHHSAPRWLLEHATVAIIDLLKVPENSETIRGAIWKGLVDRLDRDGLLVASRDLLLEELFDDRFAVAKKQDLAGLSATSEAYNVKLNALVGTWKQDLPYCAKRLTMNLAKRGRGVIAVLDNTDQYSAIMQDFCFTSAQEISDALQCVTLISMREERFHDSKIHGVLDAFQNSGFHISSPKPADVFKRRLDYTLALLGAPSVAENVRSDRDETNFVQDASTYLRILSKEFSNDNSPLNRFLTACAHGDIRLSLDLFRSFLMSGYTNVEEMIVNRTWNFQMHQIIRPVMVPNRYFYDESISDIPNIYQARNARNASHFTALRILRKLIKGVDPNTPSYFSVGELKAYFAETFSMIDDFERNLDVLLKHGLVESNNRLDTYSDAVDSIKATAYGMYAYNELAYNFTYMDLVCMDCSVFSESVSSYLTTAALNEYGHFMRNERSERVKIRLDRVDTFISYLQEEELYERDMYSLGMPVEDMFSSKARVGFELEKGRVVKSLNRQNFGKKKNRR